MAKAFLVFLAIALMQQTPDQFPICDGARSAGRSHRAACSAANRHQNHYRSAQPMSLLGQKRTNRPRPKSTFVRCYSAASTDRRNTSVKSLCWGFKLQGLAWSLVELTRYFVEMSLRVHRQVGALRKVLPQ